jgi:F-type H+/Na+-transporting ATPase subunit alpha
MKKQLKMKLYILYLCLPSVKKNQPFQIFETLTNENAMEYTIIVAATASDPFASLQFLAPYVGCFFTIGEYFRDLRKTCFNYL